MLFTLEVKDKGQFVVHKFEANSEDEIMSEIIQFMKMIGIDNVELETIMVDPTNVGIS
jgi:hypothetical protein